MITKVGKTSCCGFQRPLGEEKVVLITVWKVSVKNRGMVSVQIKRDDESVPSVSKCQGKREMSSTCCFISLSGLFQFDVSSCVYSYVTVINGVVR